MMWTELDSTELDEANLREVMAALLRAPAGLAPLLEAAVGPIMAGAQAPFGALLAVSDGAILAAALGEDGFAEAVEPALCEPLWTQGAAGYAAARGRPLLLRDIAADPRWGPPSLDPSFPESGSALAVPLGEPAEAVLVLVAPGAEVFTVERIAWVVNALEGLRQPLSNAVLLDHTLDALNRLDARDRLRRDLGAMALHDMRSPLHNIQLALKALDRLTGASNDAEMAAQAHDLIRMGQHSAALLASLSKTLLDVSRLEDDHLTLAAQQAPLDDAIQAALAAAGALIDSSGCRVETELAPGLPAVPHDPALIERVVANLLDNAIKHTPPGGLIRVSAAPFASGVCVRVADSGPGIPPDLREEIFSKYFQIRPQNGARLDGVGLGLAFCRLAVTAHGGEIWAEDGAERGAVFAFTLPGPREEN
jgi:signal transduction histidine kinase